jgi:hypothetical protein
MELKLSADSIWQWLTVLNHAGISLPSAGIWVGINRLCGCKGMQSRQMAKGYTSQLPYLLNVRKQNIWEYEVWGFHGGHYEECRLLGYKTPVPTSQEAHYVSATVLSRLMLCKIWGFHGGDYEKCRLLGYKNPVHTSQETHYVSTTKSSWLMLCKIWGFHGGDYEKCRLLGYKNPVRTSQETHYLSATETSQLMLCKIWGFHGSDYEE